MARFFVGQRVRLVRGLDLVSPAKNIGLQGRIAAFVFRPKGTISRDGTPLKIDCDCAVYWDDRAVRSAQNTAQLEPILPEGQQPTAWPECLWRPDGSHKTEKVAEEGRALALRALYG